MFEPFILQVIWQGKELELKARFERWGYTHRIAVLINDATFTFEPDEEGGYRALAASKGSYPESQVDPGLLHAVAQKLISLHHG